MGLEEKITLEKTKKMSIAEICRLLITDFEEDAQTFLKINYFVHCSFCKKIFASQSAVNEDNLCADCSVDWGKRKIVSGA